PSIAGEVLNGVRLPGVEEPLEACFLALRALFGVVWVQLQRFENAAACVAAAGLVENVVIGIKDHAVLGRQEYPRTRLGDFRELQVGEGRGGRSRDDDNRSQKKEHQQ